MIGLPNPYVMLGALGLVIGAFFYGSHIGHVSEKAKYLETQALIQKAADEGALKAAGTIGKLKIQNTTIKGQTETIIREVPVYRDCHNTPDIMRLLNDALGASPGSLGPGSGKLPESEPAH